MNKIFRVATQGCLEPGTNWKFRVNFVGKFSGDKSPKSKTSQNISFQDKSNEKIKQKRVPHSDIDIRQGISNRNVPKHLRIGIFI